MIARTICDARGYTLVEFTIAMVVITVVALILVFTLQTGHNASSSLNSNIDQSEALRRCLRRLAEEVRTASRIGEDSNENGALDDGEDGNGNGRLDADWKLEENSITFNRLVGLRTFSLPITYRLQGSDLMRDEWHAPDGKKTSIVFVSSVAAFTIKEENDKIVFELGLTKRLRGSRSVSAKQAIAVAPRN